MFMRRDAIVMMGGCDGTTRNHMGQVAAELVTLNPRALPERPVALRLADLEPFELGV
jgi:5-methyltetrahydrofolate--homocysteine methyltransferase